MQFIADAVLVVARRGDDKEKRLLPGIAGTFRQYIIKMSVRLSMDFVKDQARYIQAMLGMPACDCISLQFNLYKKITPFIAKSELSSV